jgi:rod shape-determining protein MreB
MLNKIFGLFSKDIGVDLGTANTLVYVRGKGITINEPSTVAINQKTGEILAIGKEAKLMVGRTPAHIVATRPLVNGVVSDFEVTEKMLKYFFDKVHLEQYPYLPHRPRVIIGVPSGSTEVERRAVEEAARNAGAREVYLVEEPMAAAIGAQLPIQDPGGNFIIDIGGGTTEIAVISLGGIVISKSLRIAGDRLNEDIIRYSREELRLAIGERTAEEAKISIGSAKPSGEERQTILRGRDITTGLPREVIVTEGQLREAMAGSIRNLIEAIKTTIEKTPPELVADLMTRGIIMTGGGSLLRGLSELISEETEVPVKIADDPLSAVVRGTGIILEDIDKLREVLISTQYEPTPQ